MLLWLLLSSVLAHAQSCPVDDEDAPIRVKTPAGHTLVLCGFEDREVPTTKGKRAFSEFEIFLKNKDAAKAPLKVFSAEESETYWVKELPGGRGVELEELWFFDEKPEAALRRELVCEGDACKLSEPACVFKRANAFPKALTQFQSLVASGKIGDEGEELLDQIFARAMNGDAAAKAFYDGPAPKLEPALKDVFDTNKKKLALGCKR